MEIYIWCIILNDSCGDNKNCLLRAECYIIIYNFILKLLNTNLLLKLNTTFSTQITKFLNNFKNLLE
jgi:hypothetical protein